MFKKILNKLKSLTKKQPELNEEDEFIIKAFYKKLENIISYKLWRKVVLKYSADTMSDIYDSCDILVDIIYKKYSK